MTKRKPRAKVTYSYGFESESGHICTADWWDREDAKAHREKGSERILKCKITELRK